MPDKNEETAFKNINYNNKTVSVPTPDKMTDVDTEHDFYNNIIDASQNGIVDLNTINNFTNISRSRDTVYDLLDLMCEDPIMSIALEIYTADACEPNDKGEIVPDNDALSKALDAMKPEEIDTLANEVEKFRGGKMTTDRIAKMNKWGSEASKLPELEEKNREARKVADPLTAKGGRNSKYQELTGGFTRAQMNKQIKDAKMANKYLKKSYESFRELNDRIATSRELKFNISDAEKRLNELQGGKK